MMMFVARECCICTESSIGGSENKRMKTNSKMNIRRYVMNMASASADSASSYSRSELYGMNNQNIVVGLNGALQKRFVLPNEQSLVPGNVHRATRVDFGVGGKGQDVAIALHCLSDEGGTGDQDGTAENSSNNIRLVQFIGTGFAGDAVHSLLNDRLGKEAMELTVRTSSEMRTCTSIVAADETTELVEPSGIITNDELGELFSAISGDGNEDDRKESPRSICIMGSMPPGCPEDTYAKIYGQLAGPNTVCVVDSLAGIVPLLQTISELGNGDEPSATGGPILFKMNASELCKLAGTSKSNSETDGVAVSELMNAIEGFLSKYLIAKQNKDSAGVIGLAITDGKHDAYFVTIANKISQDDEGVPSRPFNVFQLPVPNLEHGSSRILYPIGAGDAVAAGTVAAWTSLAASSFTASSSLPSAIPNNLLASLVAFVERISEHSSAASMELTAVQVQAIAAFAFGLACGSASCLREENSVLDVSDVNALFQETNLNPPKIMLAS